MKILFIHHVSDMYGASRSLLRLARRLIEDGEQVSVILHEGGRLQEELSAVGATVRLVPNLPVLHRNRLTSLSGLLRLAGHAFAAGRTIGRIVDELNPDLIHANTATILPVAGRVARRRGIPFIQHYRESFAGFGLLWPPYRAWLAVNATRIICISDYLAGEFTPARIRRKVRVARNGIPLEAVAPPDPAARETFRRQWNLAPPVISLIGRINPARKGQDTFLRAAALVRPHHPEATFLIVGSPFPGNESMRDRMMERIRELGLESCVVVAGQADDIRVALANTDISIMASTIPEGLGNVTIESMGMGIPVIGTRIGGTPELIEDGRTGLLTPPGDPAALAAAIGRLLGDPELRRSMGEAARQRFVHQLSFDPFYARIRGIYMEALEESRR